MASEKVFNIPKQQPLLQSSATNNRVFNNVKPSVPDVSLFESVLIPTNRVSASSYPNSRKSPTNMLFQKSQKSSKENIFEAAVRPTVPDVTILDEEPKIAEPQNFKNQVFSESYKKLLIKSHEQFMKQMKNDSSTEEVNKQHKKPGLFNQKFQDNPLRKYAPKPQPVTYQNDMNSSSILQECDLISPPSSATEEKTDEMTFKKVAEMLSKIQRLVVPGKTTPNELEQDDHSQVSQVVFLRKLATSYLTREELEFYEVERELNELEKEVDNS